MRRILIGCAVSVAASVLLSAAEAAPKLVVLVVIDQMRADYVERFHDTWSSGLRRLVDQGAWFTRAAYPYLTTVTCAGHATVATGAYPRTHGVFANTWFDRERGAVIPCTDDQQVRLIPYNREGRSRTGPGRLMAPTLADQLRAQNGRVVTLALKARSAIMMAGRGGDAVTWISESLDGWETSTAYAKEPVPAVKAYTTANPLDADFDKVWTRMLPLSQYQGPDDGLAEAAVKGWTSTFPHPLRGENGRPDASYFDQWQHSPYADAYVARMAAGLVESMQLGKHDGPDFLGVSFSSPDLVGHSFGPRSHEVQDMFANLDRSVGTLLNELDRLVGPGEYVLGLTSDHGVAEMPEQLRKAGRDGGRVSASAILNAGEARAVRDVGLGKHLSRLNGNDLYFEPGVYDQFRRRPGTLQAIVSAMATVPGVQKVFTADEVANAAKASDPLLRAAALSYVKGRSGDLILALKPGWVFSGAGTTHGSANAEDQRVPLVMFGRGIKAGRYDAPASPADLAPTLAAVAGVALPTAEGRTLTEALR